MAKLAIKGGKPVREKPFPSWPIYGDEEYNALKEVLESKVWGVGGSKKVEFEKKVVKFNGEDVTLMIWDFGGEERFREFLPSFCRGANAALLVYDVTRKKSLLNLEEWLKLTRRHAGDIPVILVGAKCDLEKKVFEEDVRKFMQENNVAYWVETSSKNNINVEKPFGLAVKLVMERVGMVTNVVA